MLLETLLELHNQFVNAVSVHPYHDLKTVLSSMEASV